MWHRGAKSGMGWDWISPGGVKYTAPQGATN